MIAVRGTYRRGAVRIKKDLKLKEGTEVTVLVPDVKQFSKEEYLTGLRKLQGIWVDDEGVKKTFKEIKKAWKKWKIPEF